MLIYYRGGSWVNDARFVRAAYRYGVGLLWYNYDIGFRLVRSFE